MPATVEKRGSGTIVSPWPPSTNECTFSTDTLSSIATKVLMRAESSTPAMPMMRSRGNFVSRKSACDMASSGLATGTTIAFGVYCTRLGAMLFMMSKLSRTRSSRLIPASEVSRGDHDDVRAGRRVPVGAADQSRVAADDRARLVDVERHTRRLRLGDVDDDDIGELLLRDGARNRHTDVAGATDHSDFAIHAMPRAPLGRCPSIKYRSTTASVENPVQNTPPQWKFRA
jgi:hypothetical protein